jgi:hypothetical protein
MKWAWGSVLPEAAEIKKLNGVQTAMIKTKMLSQQIHVSHPG